MPLTPEDVHKKTFTPVRLREGYDMGEVDQFLDEVEVELTRLHAENDDLRQQAGGGAVGAASRRFVQQPEPSPSLSRSRRRARAGAWPVRPCLRCRWSARSPRRRAPRRGLLEIATQNADQLVAEAQNEADKIIGEAQIKSERLETDAKTKSDRLEADARSRAEKLDSETSQRRAAAVRRARA